MFIDRGIKKNTENGNGRGIIIKVVGIEFTVIQKEIDHLHAGDCWLPFLFKKTKDKKKLQKKLRA